MGSTFSGNIVQNYAVPRRESRITAQTYYCWRTVYGGLQIDRAWQLKEQEQDNAKLKRLVSELSAGRRDGGQVNWLSSFVRPDWPSTSPPGGMKTSEIVQMI